MQKIEQIIKEIIIASRQYDTVNVEHFVDKILALDQPQEEIKELPDRDTAGYDEILTKKSNEQTRAINKQAKEIALLKK